MNVSDGMAVAVPEMRIVFDAVKFAVIPGGSPVTVASEALPDN